MASNSAGPSSFVAVPISICIENIVRVTDTLSSTSPVPWRYSWEAREFEWLRNGEGSGVIFIYLNNFVVSEKLCGFVIAD